MAEDSLAVIDAVRESGGDHLRTILLEALEQIMDMEVSAACGAPHGVRSDARTNYRNGYRRRPWDTRVGRLELAIPRLREQSYYPSFLEPRRRVEKALFAVVAEAYVQGVSTRSVDALVKAMGAEAYPSLTSRASVRNWTSKSRTSSIARWRGRIRICGSMRPMSRCAKEVGSSIGLWWSRLL